MVHDFQSATVRVPTVPRLRPRFTVRGMMILVAVVAMGLAYRQARERWAIFRYRAEYHGHVEEVFRAAADGQGFMYKARPEVEHFDPEPPPLSPYDASSWEPTGCISKADYHARMRRYWESRW
jgi:hypothetical protein